MSAGEQELTSIELTGGLAANNISFETFAKNIWGYIMNFYPDGPKPYLKMDVFLGLMTRTGAILEKEPTVVELSDVHQCAGPSCAGVFFFAKETLNERYDALCEQHIHTLPSRARVAERILHMRVLLMQNRRSTWLQGEVTVMGPIYGEGDSLITLLSLVGMPPQKVYIFLGCYFGLGFAPLESLMLLFCLKCLYPTKIYLLKGHLEEAASIKNLGLDDWLLRRRIPADSVAKVSDTVMRTVAMMPIAAMIGPKILCLPGGPGPVIRENGLAALKACSRMSMSQQDRSICMEAAWAVMKLEANPVVGDDGIPTFTESECTAFCKANGLVLIIRGRQLVDEGFLNYPKEVLTIVSAVAYLDNFRNYAAAITIQGMNASVVRYKMDEGEPKSLDIVKPGIGRNATALPM